MRRTLILAAIAGSAAFGMISPATANSVNFGTFVSTSSLAAAEGGNTSAIAFNYTGSGFVGSVYYGNNNNVLFSTDLNGGNVQTFGQPIPNFSGEVVLGVGLGQSGFAKGAVYAGNGAGNQIYRVPSSGAPVLFGATASGENIRQVFFDPGNSFGGNMLVSTSSGNIYSFASNGTRSLIASIGVDTEGLDIAGSAFGKYAGDLLVASELTGAINAINPLTHQVTNLGVYIPNAETVSVVPVNLGASGNPVEGFYVANYPYNIQKASANQFGGLLGDAIVTSEDGGNSRVWSLVYDQATDSFSASIVGNLPNQSEDGIFVTAQREQLLNGVPEPSTWAMMLMGFGGLVFIGRRRAKNSTAAA